MKPMRRDEDSLSDTAGAQFEVERTVLSSVRCVVRASSAVLIVLEVLSYISTATAPDPYIVFQFISSMLMSVVYGVMLLVMRGVAKDVSRGRSLSLFRMLGTSKSSPGCSSCPFALNLFISPDFIEMIHVGNTGLIGLVSDRLGDIQRSISTSNPSLPRLSFASRSLPFGSTGALRRPIRMITCRGLNAAKHLMIELEAVLLEKGKSSKDLVRATGHTTVNVSRIRQAEDARHQDGHPHGNLSRAGLPAGRYPEDRHR